MHVADTALGDAEGQGLTPGSLGEKVAKVAKDVVHTAKESAEREGIDPHSLGEKAKHVGESVKQKGKEELQQKKSSEKEADRFGAESSVRVADAKASPGGASTAVKDSKLMGGLSDAKTETSVVQSEGKTKHEVAEGMSAASEKSKQKGGSGCES